MATRKHPSVEGQTFGDMRVVKEHTTGHLRSYYEGICVCGRPVFTKKEYIHDKLTKRGHYYYSCRHNHLSKPHVKLGATRKDSELHYTYKSWESMRYRCLNVNSPDYHRYGGRGITICRSWDSFENFLHDMGMRLEGTSLGRINNNGNYEPSNCRWETPKEQQNNTSYNKIIEGYSISELAAKTGLTYNAIELRLRRGATLKDIIETPKNHRMEKHLRATDEDIGMRNGKLVVIKVHKTDKEVVYTCKCDCGNIKEVTRRNFTKTQSCGCLKKEAAKAKLPASPSTISEEFSSFPLFTSSLLNKKFGRLTVIEVRRKTLKRGVYKQYAKCLCDCGKEAVVFVGNLPNGHTTSCGCAKSNPVENPVSSIKPGDRFGKLVVVNTCIKHSAQIVTCRCDCGSSREVDVAGAHLKYGRVVSCGCDGKNEDVKVDIREDKVVPTPVEVEVIPSVVLKSTPDPNSIDALISDFLNDGSEDLKIEVVPTIVKTMPVDVGGYAQREVEYRGEIKTIRQWSAELGVNLSTKIFWG